MRADKARIVLTLAGYSRSDLAPLDIKLSLLTAINQHTRFVPRFIQRYKSYFTCHLGLKVHLLYGPLLHLS